MRLQTYFALSLVLSGSVTSLPTSQPGLTAQILTAQATVSNVYSFVDSEHSWVENLAVQRSGKILATRLDSPPAVYQVDSDRNTSILVHAWDAAVYKGCLGITESTTDVFYVIVAAIINGTTYTKTSGVSSVFRIDMSTFSVHCNTGNVASPANVTKVVDIPEADLLNGMTTLDDDHILVSDSTNGIVYRIDTAAGTYSVAVDDPLMKYNYGTDNDADLPRLGSNGIHIYGCHLYWTNTAAGFLARIPIRSDGSATGPSSIAVTNVPRADDFFIRNDGTAFICQNQQDTLSIAYLNTTKSVEATPIAGSNTSTILAGVTAAKFGRSRNSKTTLYLSTSGGNASPINGSITVAGGISSIDTTYF